MGIFIDIREKYGYVLIGVIAFAIIGFLLMDGLQNPNNAFQNTDNNAGSINGYEITYPEYQTKVDEAIQNYQLQYNTTNIPEQTMTQLRNDAWNQYVQEKLMGEQYNILGINVTKQELYDLFQGDNPHPVVQQQFQDPTTGTFNPQQIALFIQNLGTDDQNMSSAEKTMRWRNFEKFIKTDRLNSKYNNLVKQSVYTPDWLAKLNYKLESTTVDLQYLLFAFSDVAENEVTVTDADLQAYLNDHKKEFEQGSARSFSYVVFNVAPSAQDTAKALQSITETAGKLADANNDSIFVKLYSETPFDPNYYGKGELVSSIADTFFTIDSGAVVGPYQEKGSFVVAKLVDRKMIADSVQARQIFFSGQVQTQEELQLKRDQADSLQALIAAGDADFESLAIQYSDDEETKFDGGKLGWIKPGEQFQTINKALFYTYSEGDVFVVPSDRGFHVMQITKSDQNKEAVKVAYVTQEIRPSKNTSNAKYTEANQYRTNHSDAESFNAADMNIKTASNILINASFVPNIGEARDLVKWSYNAKVGEVSPVFILEDRFVIALLTEAAEKGTPTVAGVKGKLEAAVKKQKKAELLADKIGSSKDLNALASANGKTVLNASDVSFKNVTVGAFAEPVVAGTALSMDNGEVSGPITGTQGVYIVKVTSKTPATEGTDLSIQKMLSTQTEKFRVDEQLYPAIKEASDVEDLRYKFF